MHKPRYLRATVDLVFADACRLVLHAGLPCILVAEVLQRIAAYASPPMVRRDVLVVRAGQLDLSLLATSLIVPIAWGTSMATANRFSARLESGSHTVVRAVSAMILASAASLFLLTVILLPRVSFDSSLLRAAITLSGTLPVLTLTPAITRLRSSPALTVLAMIFIACCVLGFFGRFSPLHADTLLTQDTYAARWMADGMASVGCLLVSLALARSSYSDPRCG